MLCVEPCTKQHIEALLLGPSMFERQFGIRPASDFQPARQHLEASLMALVNEDVEPCWWTHMFIYGEPRTLIGLGGYMGNPGADHSVEIGYDLCKSYRGRGLATEALKILIDRALRCEQVHTVCAHTLARESSSTDSLQQAGMTLIDDRTADRSWHWAISKLASVDSSTRLALRG